VRAVGPIGVQYARRVKPGAYYTDGKCLAEVYRVYELGHIQLLDVQTNEILGYGIEEFRRNWWLVKGKAEAA
jgi:hypothetical protein